VNATFSILQSGDFEMSKIASNKNPVFLSILGLTLALATQVADTAESVNQPHQAQATSALIKPPNEQKKPSLEMNENVPIAANLKKWLESRNIKTIVLIDGDGKLKPIDIEGKEFKTSEKAEDTKIPANGKPEGMSPTFSKTITIEGYAHPPKSAPDPAQKAMPAFSSPFGCKWMCITINNIPRCGCY
jgi:hypothetical protein